MRQLITEHIIKDSDTLQHIARMYYGDSNLWKQLVVFNNLDFPYITSDQTFNKEIPASGNITFYLESTKISDITISENTVVYSNDTPNKKYKTIESKTLMAGNLSVECSVECLFTGLWGNIHAESIDSIVSSPDVDLLVKNLESFTNGFIFNVKKTGETIQIPSIDALKLGYVVPGDSDYLEIIGGKDLMLYDRDFLADQYGDLTSVQGIQSIMYSIKHRLETEKGELVTHPDYGSNLENIIGIQGSAVNKQKLIELEIKETVFQDNRIEDLEFNEIQVLGDKVTVDCSVTVIGKEEAMNLIFDIYYGG